MADQKKGTPENAGEQAKDAAGDPVCNSSGIPLKRFYTEQDNDARDMADPGQFPFTRGLFDTGYRTRLWTMRQYAGYATADESNKRFRYLLEQGQTGLSVAFDLPTQMGYDSDHTLAEGEAGKVGVAIDSLRDMEFLMEGIPLDRVTTSMTINAPAAILLAMYMVVAERQGISADKLSGTVQNDILKEYVARGTYIYPPRPSVRLAADLMAYCAKEIPRWNAISVSGYHIRDAGLKNVTCEQADIYSLPYQAGEFDAVVAANVLHLVPDLSAAIEALRKVMKPGGSLVVPTFCHDETRLSWLVSRILAVSGFPGHRRFTTKSLRSSLEANGLKVVRAELIPGLIPIGFVEGVF